jgi:hypothetical protein
VKHFLRAIPGFSAVNSFRKAVRTTQAGGEFAQPGMDQRCGDFHLLAIFRKA